jgi:hypothetical protein
VIDQYNLSAKVADSVLGSNLFSEVAISMAETVFRRSTLRTAVVILGGD